MCVYKNNDLLKSILDNFIIFIGHDVFFLNIYKSVKLKVKRPVHYLNDQNLDNNRGDKNC